MQWYRLPLCSLHSVCLVYCCQVCVILLVLHICSSLLQLAECSHLRQLWTLLSVTCLDNTENQLVNFKPQPVLWRGHEILDVRLSLIFLRVVNFDEEKYLIRVKRDKNRLALAKFDQTDQRRTVIKITSTLLQAKCFCPIFNECSNDKKKNVCYIICEPWDLYQ